MHCCSRPHRRAPLAAREKQASTEVVFDAKLLIQLSGFAQEGRAPAAFAPPPRHTLVEYNPGIAGHITEGGRSVNALQELELARPLLGRWAAGQVRTRIHSGRKTKHPAAL
jgi:hypothetical protein